MGRRGRNPPSPTRTNEGLLRTLAHPPSADVCLLRKREGWWIRPQQQEGPPPTPPRRPSGFHRLGGVEGGGGSTECRSGGGKHTTAPFKLPARRHRKAETIPNTTLAARRFPPAERGGFLAPEDHGDGPTAHGAAPSLRGSRERLLRNAREGAGRGQHSNEGSCYPHAA